MPKRLQEEIYGGSPRKRRRRNLQQPSPVAGEILPLPVPKHLAVQWMKEIATASMQAVRTPVRKTSVAAQELDVDVAEGVDVEADVGAMVAAVAAMVAQKVFRIGYS
eukprot:jgi/Phyca11/13479/fgenesh1_pg.PHYCAscaffold_4_\